MEFVKEVVIPQTTLIKINHLKTSIMKLTKLDLKMIDAGVLNGIDFLRVAIDMLSERYEVEYHNILEAYAMQRLEKR